MFSRASLCFGACRNFVVVKSLTRNIGVTAACSQAAVDPIQKLFVDKIHDYSAKSKSAGGKLVDASPATEKSLKDELEKLARQYGAAGVDFSKFPTFSFTDPTLEPVGIQADIKAAVSEHDDVAAIEEDDKPYFEE